MAKFEPVLLKPRRQAATASRSTPTAPTAATARCAKALAMTPAQVVEDGQGLGPARPRRRRLPVRAEVDVPAARTIRRRSTCASTPTRASRARSTTAS